MTVLDGPTVTRYRVTFERIGRTHDVADLVCLAVNSDHLAEQIYRYARAHLLSSEVVIHVAEDELTGWIGCGFQVGGSFTVAAEAHYDERKGNPSPRKHGDRAGRTAVTTFVVPETRIGELGLSTRTRNSLMREGINTVKDLLPYSDADLLDIPQFGKGQLIELRRVVPSGGRS